MFENFLLISCVVFMFWYGKWTVKAFYEEAKRKNEKRAVVRKQRINDDFIREYDIFFGEVHGK